MAGLTALISKHSTLGGSALLTLVYKGLEEFFVLICYLFSGSFSAHLIASLLSSLNSVIRALKGHFVLMNERNTHSHYYEVVNSHAGLTVFVNIFRTSLKLVTQCLKWAEDFLQSCAAVFPNKPKEA